MEINRAKQILSSPKEIDVHYHGVPIWIKSVNETSSMATVHARGTHDEDRMVPVLDLEEK